MKKYSQVRAMFAITRASLISIFRSPSSVVFGFAFPLIFILVFGFIGNSGGLRHYTVAIEKDTDTTNDLFKALQSSEQITIKRYRDSVKFEEDIQKGRIAATIDIQKNSARDGAPYVFSMKSSTSSNDQWPQFKSLAESIIDKVSAAHFPDRQSYANFDFNYQKDIAQIRQYKTIDFILPGQLGFSLLASGVFGVAFTFFILRNTLVLKRFFATPVSRAHIIMGEMISRILFQMLTAVVIILLGKYFFGFTLIHGTITFVNMMILSFIGLFVFMGFGFLVSSIAKNESTIPPIANIITLPQFLIGGTFFSISVFPVWLQWIARMLPLTHLNEALRQVAFEGASLWDVKAEIGILLIWGIAVYLVTVKIFKWE